MLLSQSLTRTTCTHDRLGTTKAQSLLLRTKGAKLTGSTLAQLRGLQASLLVRCLRCLLAGKVCGLQLHSLVECLLIELRAESSGLLGKPEICQSLCNTLARTTECTGLCSTLTRLPDCSLARRLQISQCVLAHQLSVRVHVAGDVALASCAEICQHGLLLHGLKSSPCSGCLRGNVGGGNARTTECSVDQLFFTGLVHGIKPSELLHRKCASHIPRLLEVGKECFLDVWIDFAGADCAAAF